MAHRRSQQQTLSIRVSATLREFLESARLVISNGRGEVVSTSDVAKLLLESAVDDGLDHRIEVAHLQGDVTESLSAIRQKWELDQSLTHAEWLLLARFVQFGCEEVSPNQELPGAESLAQLLQAFLAVRSLRTDRGVELDRYYLGNLGLERINERRLDPERVPETMEKLTRQLRQSDTLGNRPISAGRNLYVAIRDERLPGVVALNAALKPFLPGLFRLAARGHWLRKRQPIRRPAGLLDVSLTLSTLESDDIRIALLVKAGELQVIMTFGRKSVTYPLENYPTIRDFATTLVRLEAGNHWNGMEFFGDTLYVGTDAQRFSFCRRDSGITILFRPEEWCTLKDLFSKALSLREIQPVLSELSVVYGEI